MPTIAPSRYETELAKPTTVLYGHYQVIRENTNRQGRQAAEIRYGGRHYFCQLDRRQWFWTSRDTDLRFQV